MWIYEVSKPDPSLSHSCRFPVADTQGPGSIWQCDRCGRYWMYLGYDKYLRTQPTWRRWGLLGYLQHQWKRLRSISHF